MSQVQDIEPLASMLAFPYVLEFVEEQHEEILIKRSSTFC